MNNSNSVVFICNSSNTEGLGHFSRCFNIAIGLSEVDPSIIIYFDGIFCSFAYSKIKSYNYQIVNKSDNYYDLYRKSIVILDSYLHTEEFINKISLIAKHTLKIDDFNTYDLSQIDCVINFRVGAENQFYNSKKSLLGLKYYPSTLSLRDLRIRNIENLNKKDSTKIKKILIFIGGTDHNNTGELLISLLDEVVSGKSFIYIKRQELKKDLSIYNNNLHIQPLEPDVSAALADIDCVICGGGLMKYDSSYSLIPAACLSQTEEQEVDSKESEVFGLTFNLGRASKIIDSREEVFNSLRNFLKKDTQLQIKKKLLEKYYTNSILELSKEIISLYN